MMNLSTRILYFLDVAERAVTVPEISDALAVPDERAWEELATMVEPGYVRYDEQEDGSTAWCITNAAQKALEEATYRKPLDVGLDWSIAVFANLLERIEQRLEQVERAVSGTPRPAPVVSSPGAARVEL